MSLKDEFRMSWLRAWLFRRPKPYFAYLNDEQMKGLWDRYKRDGDFWKELKITVVHTNDFYKTFIKLPDGQYYELKGVPGEVVTQYEILGETVYEAKIANS